MNILREETVKTCRVLNPAPFFNGSVHFGHFGPFLTIWPFPDQLNNFKHSQATVGMAVAVARVEAVTTVDKVGGSSEISLHFIVMAINSQYNRNNHQKRDCRPREEPT